MLRNQADTWENRTVVDLYRSSGDMARIEDWCQRRLDAWPVRNETERLETCLGRTHLTWAGTSGQAVCLYLPGTNFNAATSTTVLTALSLEWRVVCADLPGQPGLSAATRPDDEIAGYRKWMAEVIAHVRQRYPSAPLVVVGHSRGAAVALSGDPSTVDGLVMVSPAGLAKVRLSPMLLRRSISWLLRPTPARSRRLLLMMAGGVGDAGLEPLVGWMTLVAECTRTTGAPGPLPTRVVDRWRGRNLRVLVGELDVFFPAARIAGPARRLGARLDVAPNAGHLFVDQRPELVAATVRQMLV